MTPEKALSYVGALTASYFVYRVSSFAYLYLRPSSLPRYLRTEGGQKSWALITGASDGIGEGFAQELCAHGFNVILHGRNEQKLLRVKESLCKEYPAAEVRIVIADAGSFTASTIDEIVATLKNIRLTVLINNVGGTGSLGKTFNTLDECSSKDVDAIININATFTTQITRALLPTLQQNEPALIMNIGSQAQVGMPWLSLYSGTKAYLRAWTNSLSLELKANNHQIEVMCMTVGNVRSHQNPVEVSAFVPTSRVLARAALQRVGCGRASVTAYLPHALQWGTVQYMPTAVLDALMTANVKALVLKEAKQS